MFLVKMKRKKRMLRAIGINNICYDLETNKRKSVQFYDYDTKHIRNSIIKILPDELQEILKYFKNDCIIYKTKHGFHFISFALLPNVFISKANVLRITKRLNETQDYFPYQKELTLRVSPKWKIKRFSKRRKTISKKPKFASFFIHPRNNMEVSKTHLNFYLKYMNLPIEIYKEYEKNCILKENKITISHYRTRD